MLKFLQGGPTSFLLCLPLRKSKGLSKTDVMEPLLRTYVHIPVHTQILQFFHLLALLPSSANK